MYIYWRLGIFEHSLHASNISVLIKWLYQSLVVGAPWGHYSPDTTTSVGPLILACKNILYIEIIISHIPRHLGEAVS